MNKICKPRSLMIKMLTFQKCAFFMILFKNVSNWILTRRTPSVSVNDRLSRFGSQTPRALRGMIAVFQKVWLQHCRFRAKALVFCMVTLDDLMAHLCHLGSN